jgi:threonine aldolase
MTNQIAIKVHTQPGDEVICDTTAHVYQYEGGGIALNSGASVKLLNGDRGRITAEQVAAAVNAEDIHKAHTSLVCIENTSNRGGGSCYRVDEIEKIRTVCDKNNLALHLDGARLFNAMIAERETPEAYGKAFHSISICLSKGLGCPVGSVLLGTEGLLKNPVASAKRLVAACGKPATLRQRVFTRCSTMLRGCRRITIMHNSLPQLWKKRPMFPPFYQ